MPTASLLPVAAMAATAQATADPHSCAETGRFIVRDVALDLRADFEARRLDRSAFHRGADGHAEVARSGQGRELGRRIFAIAKPGYHASVRAAAQRALWPDVGGGP